MIISSVAIINIGQNLISLNFISEQAAVHVADLPAGVYLLRINGSDVRKFLKE